MKKCLQCPLFLLFFTTCLSSSAQISIDHFFREYQTGLVRYSLYIPSQYAHESDVPLLVALRPAGQHIYSASSWRNALRKIAEANNMLLVCPENGPDGRWLSRTDFYAVDQVVDSVRSWYRVNPKKIYLMGFGEGAVAAIKSNVRRPALYNGLLVMGASSRYATEFGRELKRLAGQPVMMVHGKRDQLSRRFHPLREALMSAGARVHFQLVDDFGHQYPFPNNPQIFQDAFAYFAQPINSFRLQGRRFQATSRRDMSIKVVPNPVRRGGAFKVQIGTTPHIFPKISIYRADGILVRVLRNHPSDRAIASLPPGIYDLFIQVQPNQTLRRKVLIKEVSRPSEW